MRYSISHNLVTESIVSQYGEFSFEIVDNKLSRRTTVFKNRSSETILCAIVYFDTLYSEELMIIHSKVCSGLLIGETIISMGYKYTRETIATCELTQVELYKLRWETAYCTLSNIFIGYSDKQEYYCSICEIYNPNFNIAKVAIRNNKEQKTIERILLSENVVYKSISNLV